MKTLYFIAVLYFAIGTSYYLVFIAVMDFTFLWLAGGFFLASIFTALGGFMAYDFHSIKNTLKNEKKKFSTWRIRAKRQTRQ